GFDPPHVRRNASTGILEDDVYFNYGNDLFLTQSSTFLVGSYDHPPGMCDESLPSIGTLSTEVRLFVTQYATAAPTPTPTPSATPTTTPSPTPCTGRCSPTPRPRHTPHPRP